MSENPLLVTAMLVGAVVFFRLWWNDYRAAARGESDPRAFPGATGCRRQLLLVAVFGSLLLVGLETAGETILGISGEQQTVTVLWSLYTFAAAFLEELAFRGYFVVAGRGRALLWTSIAGFSVAFALAHPFLWSWSDGHLALSFTAKGWFSTAMVFLASLWFYALRFSARNPARSLLPCFVAHLAKNAAVFGVKLALGFVSGWY